MKNQILLIVFLALISITSQAQVAINTTGDTASASAALDISSSTKGLLIPRMATILRLAISTPETGLLVFDNDSNGFWFYNGASWQGVGVQSSSSTDTLSLITDADNDTKIQVEETADEDIIRFDIAGTESMIVRDNGNGNTMIEFPGTNTLGNTLLGSNAGLSLTTGTYNVFLGQGAGRDMQIGIGNTFIGRGAGKLNTGVNNTFLGYDAGANNITGDQNVFLGFKAGKFETGSNKLYIDNSTTASPLIYGDFNTNLLRINGTLNINNAFSFPIADGTSNQVLQTDGAGNLTWQNVVAGTASVFADADNDTKIQVEETADEDIIRFDIAGVEKWVFKGSRIEPVNSGKSIHIGIDAGANDDLTDNNNVFLGYHSGTLTSSGSNNIGFGENSLAANLTGGGNIAIGRSTQKNRLSGQFNTSIGTNSFQSNLTGIENTTIGSVSFKDNVNGSGNVGIGTGSGQNNNGSYNVFIGYHSGRNISGSNRLSIDNTNTASPLIYGEFDNDLLRINGTLDINNAFSFPTVDGTANQVLRTDGAGNLTWQNAVAGTASSIADADNDTKIQVEKTTDEDIIRFDVAGVEKWVMKGSRIEPLNSGKSILIGFKAGEEDDLTDNSNVFLGDYSGQKTTTGANNIGMGDKSLTSNLTGGGNIAIGRYTQKDRLSGQFNLSIGTNALQNNLTGGSNTTYGANSFQNNINGSGNVGVGNGAGKNNDGSYNVFIGFNSGLNSTGSNVLSIDNTSTTTPLIYGEFNNDLLRVNGTLNINNAYSFPATDGTANQVQITDGAGNLTWTTKHIATQNIQLSGNWLSGDGGNEGVKVYNNGFVQIGATGTLLHSIIKVTVNANVPQIVWNSTVWQAFSVPNALPGGVVYISPSAPLANKVVIGQAYVSTAGTVMVSFRNTASSGNYNPPAMNYYISVIN